MHWYKEQEKSKLGGGRVVHTEDFPVRDWASCPMCDQVSTSIWFYNSPEVLPGLHVPRHIGQSLNILVQTGTKKVDGLRNFYQSHVLSSHCVNFFALPHHSNTENSCQHVAEVKTTQGARERSINTSLYALFLRSNQTLKSSSCPSLHLDSQILCDYY